MIDEQHDNRARNSHQNAVEIQTGYAGHTEGIEQPSANHRTNDTEDDVDYQAIAGLVDEFAGNESRYESENYPS